MRLNCIFLELNAAVFTRYCVGFENFDLITLVGNIWFEILIGNFGWGTFVNNFGLVDFYSGNKSACEGINICSLKITKSDNLKAREPS